MTVTQGFTRQQVVELSARLGEPEWMRERRLAAFDQWLTAPLPSREDEAWRHTDLAPLGLDDLGALTTGNGSAPAHQLDEAGAAGVVVLHDGALVSQRLEPEHAAAGVVFTSLQEALVSHPELVRDAFMTDCVPAAEDKFTLLHAALWQAGVFCYVPRGVEVAQPLLAITSLGHGGDAYLPHTLVLADEGASVAVAEQHAGGEESTLIVSVTEVLARRGARVQHTVVQDWGDEVAEIAYRRAHVGADAEVRLCVGSLGAWLDKCFVGAVLDGRGGHCDLHGFYFPRAGQRVDNNTLQEHRASDCTSNLLFKGAVPEESEVVFRGVIRVHPDAQKTDAYQTNNNLLLGDDARADSMPVLEIEADDVKCSHGATLGSLDEEELFYLRSRGLPRADAQRMVIAGFFEPILEKLPLTGLRDWVAEELAERIERQQGAES
ncbi:MAG: Fe-S cluster assembly protein SufD [Armatimonadetes bacterium]|nr:Fe-S cluster assembly protein SufD [Armatimonadota bacterium]